MILTYVDLRLCSGTGPILAQVLCLLCLISFPAHPALEQEAVSPGGLGLMVDELPPTLRPPQGCKGGAVWALGPPHVVVC